MQKEITRDTELWADMELGLGKFTSITNNIEAFDAFYFELSEHLRDYLKYENDKFTPTAQLKVKVKEDLKQLPITVAHSIGFFFKQQLQIFFWIFRFFLIRQVKKIKMDKQKKKELIDNLKKMDLWALVSSLTFLNTVKLPTNQLLM